MAVWIYILMGSFVFVFVLFCFWGSVSACLSGQHRNLILDAGQEAQIDECTQNRHHLLFVNQSDVSVPCSASAPTICPTYIKSVRVPLLPLLHIDMYRQGGTLGGSFEFHLLKRGVQIKVPKCHHLPMLGKQVTILKCDNLPMWGKTSYDFKSVAIS